MAIKYYVAFDDETEDGPDGPVLDLHFARVALAAKYIRDAGRTGSVFRFERGVYRRVRRVK